MKKLVFPLINHKNTIMLLIITEIWHIEEGIGGAIWHKVP